MFDEPEEGPAERDVNPADRAREKADEFRMHAELAAVFEGPRKFDAELHPNFDPQLARDVQRMMGRLDKARPADSGVLPPESAADAAGLLNLPETRILSTNDYHIYRRLGEVMIVRWLQGDQVEQFYERLQAHFDAALEGCREDERQARGWKQDPKTLAYLAALDAVEVKMADRYRRDLIRQQNIYVLSTQSADELNIQYLADHIMGVPIEDLTGAASAPPDDPTEQDLVWFYKLFLLRGMNRGVEQMCFFMFMQKSDDSGW
jgi:hypothetical protein